MPLSAVILWKDRPLIATEPFSSLIIQEWPLDYHTKSSKKSKHGNMSKFEWLATSALVKHGNEAKKAEVAFILLVYR